MGGSNFIGVAIVVLIVGGIAAVIIFIAFTQSRKSFREQKNFERGLKMMPLMIHLPPPSDDVEIGSRDQRDVMDEVISQAQTMYNVISSTATKGFKSRFYGQRHISFELVASGGLIRYYVVVPIVLLEVIKQAVMAAYPTARLEEVEEINLFSDVGKISGTIGGEFSLKKEYSFPIATYQESKRDAMRALLSALSSATREDGVGLQIMIRPAQTTWVKTVEKRIRYITEGRRGAANGKGSARGLDFSYFPQILEALWKPPSSSDKPMDTSGANTEKQLSASDKEKVEALQEKTRYAGYEVLVRVVASSSTAARSQVLLGNVVSAFALFDSPTKNGFTFTPARNIEQFVTAYIFRFFPQEVNRNILNTVELATLFHLPDQNNIPSSQVERQKSKQVDGPTEIMDNGFLLGYNVFRGTKKPIRLSDNDRRRHVYVIGQTGTGKSVLQENLALQDMLDGKGFALVDPHGDLAEALLAMVPKERVEDVVYFNPGDMDYPIGLNLFEIDPSDPDPERTKDYIISEVMNMMYSLYDPGKTGIVGPRMENIVRNAALLLMDSPDGGTFMDIPYVLTDPEVVKRNLPYLKNQRAVNFWTKEWPAAQRSNDAGEVTSWVVSKWASFENAMMSNILGQLKSGLNIRDIMDNKKILLVNLSKGKMGEMASKLLGMVFVMKFQAAAMSRANIPEEERVDFTLYVDEFQNFATDSFESILSEARKYRLSLVVANQFISQLTDKVREAIIGNVGTAICGRIGVTDAEQMAKRFQPTFDAEDLMRLPNYTSVAQVLIHSVPSSPFSMDWIPPMGHPNPKLADALKKLSAAKYGRPRAEVELEIHKRVNAAAEAKEKDKQARLEAMRNSTLPPGVANRQKPLGQSPQLGAPNNLPAGQATTAQNSAMSPNPSPLGNTQQSFATSPPAAAAPGASSGSSSFLDSWLSKRQNVKPISQPPAGMTLGASNNSATPPPQSQQPPRPVPAPQQPQTPQVSTPPTLVNQSEGQGSTAPQASSLVQPSTTPVSAPSPATTTPSDQKPTNKPEEQDEEAVIAEQLREAQSAAKGTIEEAREAAAQVIKQQPAELRTVDDGVDEIFIDLRGNIHGGEEFNIIEK